MTLYNSVFVSKKNIIFQITNGFWLINEAYVLSHAPRIARIVNGEHDPDFEKDAAVQVWTTSASGAVAFGNKYEPFKNAEPGSTAVIRISGPIMKYDNCGDPGTKTYAGILSAAERHPHINSVVLIADSPGGTVDGTQELAEYVKGFSKPVVTLVDGMAASAMYWIGSSSREIIAINQTATVGSIGTMIAFADMQPKLEKEGVKFHYITADASEDKNKEFLEARKGNYALLKEKLNAINDVFLAAVKANRSGKIDTSKENVLSGKTYLADDALKFGLIDSIGGLDYAVERAQSYAREDKKPNDGPGAKNQLPQTQNSNMKKVLTLMAAQTALLSLFGATIAEGQSSVDVEMTDENIAKLEGVASVAAKAVEDIAAAKKGAEDKVSGMQTQLNAIEEKLEKIGKSNPGSTNTVKTGEDGPKEEGKVDYSCAADEEAAALRKQLGIKS